MVGQVNLTRFFLQEEYLWFIYYFSFPHETASSTSTQNTQKTTLRSTAEVYRA